MWPNLIGRATLRGEAAEIYLRWERDLKPHGFRLAARVLDFPGGMPGDIGLFLIPGANEGLMPAAPRGQRMLDEAANEAASPRTFRWRTQRYPLG